MKRVDDAELGQASCFWALPAAPRGKKKEKRKSKMQRSRKPRGNCRGTCQICSAASGASFNGTVTAGDRACHAAALRPRRHMPHASGQQGALLPASCATRQAVWQFQAYLLVGGRLARTGRVDEEACGWLQVRILIDRGKRCEGARLMAPVQRWMTTSLLCPSPAQFCVLLHTPLTRKQSESVA